MWLNNFILHLVTSRDTRKEAFSLSSISLTCCYFVPIYFALKFLPTYRVLSLDLVLIRSDECPPRTSQPECFKHYSAPSYRPTLKAIDVPYTIQLHVLRILPGPIKPQCHRATKLVDTTFGWRDGGGFKRSEFVCDANSEEYLQYAVVLLHWAK